MLAASNFEFKNRFWIMCFRVSVNRGSFASAAIPTRSKTGARAVRRFSCIVIRTSRFEGARLKAVPLQSLLLLLPKQMNNPGSGPHYPYGQMH
jgi:hypothetical protein